MDLGENTQFSLFFPAIKSTLWQLKLQHKFFFSFLQPQDYIIFFPNRVICKVEFK